MTNLARSTYYYQAKGRSPKDSDAEILQRIHKILEEFPQYGKKRIYHQLRRDGLTINHKRVERIMQENGLTQKRKKRFKVYTTDSNHDYRIYPNLIKNLPPGRLNQIWVSDLTYVRLKSGFVYVAVILDALSRKVIGYAFSERIDKELALAALEMAIQTRKPPKGCIHHSDRGVQYASHAYVDLLKAHDFQISMSGKGNPYDNAKAESFMKTLKVEEVYLADYETFEEIIANLTCFFEAIYNRKRLHSSLGYMPPDEFEAELLERLAS